MRKLLLSTLFTLMVLFAGTLQARAQFLTADSAASILVFPYYYANPSTASPIDTIIHITNIHPSDARYVKIFYRAKAYPTTFIEKRRITALSSIRRKMRDYDPLYVGSIFAVVVDENDVPIKANDLVGVAEISRYGNNSTLIKSLVPAYEIKRISSAAKTVTGGFATLSFDDVDYQKLPGAIIGFPGVPASGGQPAATLLAMPDKLAQTVAPDTPLRLPNTDRRAFPDPNQTCTSFSGLVFGLGTISKAEIGPHLFGLGWSHAGYGGAGPGGTNDGPGYENAGITWTGFNASTTTGFSVFRNVTSEGVVKPLLGIYQTANGMHLMRATTFAAPFNLAFEVNPALVCQ